MKIDNHRPTLRDRVFAILDFFEAAYLILCIIAAVCIVVYAFV